MYSDVVGFTSLCSDSLPMEVVTLLSGVFQKFDVIISQHHCYKVFLFSNARSVKPFPYKKKKKKRKIKIFIYLIET